MTNRKRNLSPQEQLNRQERPRRGRKEQPEYRLQKQVCEYIKLQYPKLFFMSDTVAFLKLTEPQKVRNKAIQTDVFKCPDLIIFKPNGTYHGLFIELKAETPYKKDGNLKKSDHLEAQQATLATLNTLRYKAVFGWEFEQIRAIIDDYLKDVSIARDEQFYYSQKDLYEEELASTYGDGAKSMLKDQWDAWSKQYKNARPLLQEDMAQGGDRQRLRQRSYQDLQNMLNDKNVTVEPAIRKVLKDMSVAYDDYIYNRDLVVGSGATANNYKDLLKQNVKATLEELATQYSNARDAYDLLFATLIGE